MSSGAGSLRLGQPSIGTASSQGDPWNSPVYSAYDDLANFYWSSSPDAQHSRNIHATGKAFLVIYDSTVPEGKGEAVYVEATVAGLDDPREIEEAAMVDGASRFGAFLRVTLPAASFAMYLM